MARLKIRTEKDPILRKISRPVEEINTRILTLLDDMAETMRRAEGVGLAAVQVGVLRRVVVIETEPGQLIELINPVIVASSGMQRTREGCLSLPGKCGITERPMQVTVEATGRDGKRFCISGTGLLAKAFCHEIDHLDGILYTDVAKKMLTPTEIKNGSKDEDVD